MQKSETIQNPGGFGRHHSLLPHFSAPDRRPLTHFDSSRSPALDRGGSRMESLFGLYRLYLTRTCSLLWHRGLRAGASMSGLAYFRGIRALSLNSLGRSGCWYMLHATGIDCPASTAVHLHGHHNRPLLYLPTTGL